MDTIEPITESVEWYEYILVIMDCFTRMTELYPTYTTNAEEAAQCLFDFINRYWSLDEIITDNGTQFVNDVIKRLTTHYIECKHLTTLAYSKEETALIERNNKEVVRFIRGLVFETKL